MTERSRLPSASDHSMGLKRADVPMLLPVPKYLEYVYWWAYVHPNAVHVFEREWLVNAILFGNYHRLKNAALVELGASHGALNAVSAVNARDATDGTDTLITGRTLQIACVYGDLTPSLYERLAPDAQLEIVDILPVQLRNLKTKLPADTRVTLTQGDSSALALPDASVDQVLLFFLLHEQPEDIRRKTLSEALRVLKPGGKMVIMDYHQPAKWHPLRLLMRLVFWRLEPFAMDLWHHDIIDFFPEHTPPKVMQCKTYFGGLYQKLVLTR